MKDLRDKLARLEFKARFWAKYRYQIGDEVGCALRLGRAGLAKELRERLGGR